MPRAARRSDQFFITAGPLEYYESVREDFLCNFECVETYCVSIEKSSENDKVHLHCYLKLTVIVSCDDIRDVISWSEGTINVQCVKSRRNVLKYISKEDKTPLFNCRSSELSFSYRASAWTRNSPSFSFTDCFVLEHPQYYRLLRELHNEIHSGQAWRKSVRKYFPLYFWPGWGYEVLLQIYKQLWCKERRALYLHGLSGLGKTYITRRALASLGLSRIYMPVCGAFFMGDYQASAYDIILFEEWSFDTSEKKLPNR
jgi:hypothetical protein